MDIVAAYSAFLHQRHGLLGNLIQVYRGETFLNPRPSKQLVVPEADFPNKECWVHIVRQPRGDSRVLYTPTGAIHTAEEP